MAKHVPRGGGTIVPDYRRPGAIMVPHTHLEITGLTESIAAWVSRQCGVILLSGDLGFSQAFVAAQSRPEHFSIITAPSNTPWLRDRSPIAVRTRRGYRWVIPQMPAMDRPLDDALFERISGRPVETAPIELPHGNLVAGPKGITLITERALSGVSRHELDRAAPVFGVRQWVVIPDFDNELTGHADVHARFLGPGLVAVAWSETDPEDREHALVIEKRVRALLPQVTVLRIPLRNDATHYASPVNWLQVGRQLLLPRYDLTPADDVEAISTTLRDAGFVPSFVYSPTLEYGGSLHCLTASLYA